MVSVNQETESSLAEWFWCLTRLQPSCQTAEHLLGAGESDSKMSVLSTWQPTSPRAGDSKEKGGNNNVFYDPASDITFVISAKAFWGHSRVLLAVRGEVTG